MKKKLLSMLLAVSLVGTMLMAGCGNKAADEPQTIDDIEAAPETPEGEEPGDTEGAGGGELADTQEMVFVLNNEPDGIDPNVTNNSFATPFLSNCFEGLVTYDEKGEVVPGNAESWESNDDLTVFTFHLREGLKWSDGTALTANDYVYSALRVLTPETTSQYVNMISDYVVNGQEFYDGTASAEDVGIKALDDNTLEFTLKASCPYFIDLVSMWVYFPVQQATIEANGDKWTASAEAYVSNGPFKITEMNMGESMVLEKNENYWNAENVTLEKLTFRYVLDTSTALTAYESGEVDGVRTVPSSDLARLKAENAGLVSTPNYGTVYYDINCSKEPYNNPLVRKALNLAIDREALINNVAQVDGQPAYSFLAPGYVVDGKDVTEGRSDFGLSSTADVEGAKAALAEAGYPDGEGFPTLQLSFYSDDNVKKIAEAIAEMWEKNLGITVEVSSAEWAVFYDAVQSGNYEVAAMGWSADYVNPMSFLPLLYTNDVTNNSFYSNPDYDAIVDQIKVEKDPAKFAELVLQADELVSAEYPVLGLYYKSNTYLIKDYIEGVYMVSSSNIYFQNAKVLAH
ncbi:MAG: peptide ABC transporter substrate-binding protein [Lachnospiraceae bacterium]|jgi:oligopeptide transport system substrate-binding protein|nr:peptide ABC transporter substrate-binding protein [Lachnospiraceae bacterium]MCI9017970.1 peptide ABC transporter substrate-binding protein [Lachnospiraceae bacterium]MCI9680746.1 peptide ABC transporter substrate-binding protein [Lachnospiraceae bacterium]